jgi:hypothetical protein
MTRIRRRGLGVLLVVVALFPNPRPGPGSPSKGVATLSYNDVSRYGHRTGPSANRHDQRRSPESAKRVE